MLGGESEMVGLELSAVVRRCRHTKLACKIP